MRALRPDDPLVYLAAGDFYSSVNPIQNDRAMEDYERGLRLAPDDVELLSAAAAEKGGGGASASANTPPGQATDNGTGNAVTPPGQATDNGGGNATDGTPPGQATNNGNGTGNAGTQVSHRSPHWRIAIIVGSSASPFCVRLYCTLRRSSGIGSR